MEFQLFGHSKVPACKDCKGDRTSLWDDDSACSTCDGEGYIKQEVLAKKFPDEPCAICSRPFEGGHVFNHKQILFLHCDACHKSRITYNKNPVYAARRAFWSP